MRWLPLARVDFSASGGGNFRYDQGMNYGEQLSLATASHPELAALMGLRGLDEIVRVLARLQFRLREIDSVTQDEFHHDVLIGFPDRRRWLVIGIS